MIREELGGVKMDVPIVVGSALYKERALEEEINEGGMRWGRYMGTSKLGDEVIALALPLAQTCSGATKQCLKRCYVVRSMMTILPARKRAVLNYKMIKADPIRAAETFAKRVPADGSRPVRMASSGDGFKELAEFIVEFCRLRERVPVWMYTRRVDFILELGRLSKRSFGKVIPPNFSLWGSVDSSTDKSFISFLRRKRIRIAYMRDVGEDVPEWADLIFPVTGLKTKIPADKRDCPHSRGKVISCGVCKRCFR